MGQYFIPVNVTKKEYIHAHAFGDGLKMGEWTYPSSRTMQALKVLKATRWAGDEVIDFVGDYENEELYRQARDEFEDVSEIAKELVANPPKQSAEKKYTLTLDKILELAHCCADNNLNSDEVETYVKSFLQELEGKNETRKKGRRRKGS